MKTEPIQIICSACGAINRVPGQRIKDAPTCGKCKQALISAQPIIATDQNLSRYIQKQDLPVVVDFWAPWCAPCQQFAPIFKQVASELAGQFSFIKLDTEANQRSSMNYGIRSIPTLMVFKSGREVARLSGALPKAQFLQWLGQYQ